MSTPITLPSSAAFQVTSEMLKQHTLNALVELYYLRVGNEVMASTMLKLEAALNATQSGLNVLRSIQGLHNQITIVSAGKMSELFQFENSQFTVDGTIRGSNVVGTVDSVESYQSMYSRIASILYGRPIGPSMSITMPGGGEPVIITATSALLLIAPGFEDQKAAFDYFVSKLQEQAEALDAVIAQLTPITPADDPTTLLAQLKTVRADFPETYSFERVRNWALDGYSNQAPSDVNSGAIQQHITAAITAAQSLNSRQSTNVRNYMFIFQQYYQSAAAVLSQTNQAMMSIARKISG